MAETNPDAEKQQIMNILLKWAMNDLYKAVDEAYPPVDVINYYQNLLGHEDDENVGGSIAFNPPDDACYGVNGTIVPTDVLVKALHQRVDILGVSAKQATDVLGNSMNREVLLEVLYHLDGVMKAHGIRKRNMIKIVEKPVKGGELHEDLTSNDGVVSLPFTNLKRDVNYGRLYDRLVAGGYLEDTGKAGFLYYYTGEGEPPIEKLKWKAEGKILSMLMRELRNNKKVPWKEMNTVFEGLNTDSMKSTLAQSKNNKGDNLQYEQLVNKLIY